MTLSPRQLSLVESEGWWTENSGETHDMTRIEEGKQKQKGRSTRKRSGRSTGRSQLIGGEEEQREPRAENRACLFFLFFPLVSAAAPLSGAGPFPFLSTWSVGPQAASTSLSTTQHPPYLYSFDSLITAESIGSDHSVIWRRSHAFLVNYQSFLATLLSAIRDELKTTAMKHGQTYILCPPTSSCIRRKPFFYAFSSFSCISNPI